MLQVGSQGRTVDCHYYHCSPTLVPRLFRPRPPRVVVGVKRAGSKGSKLIVVDSPFTTSSAMALPQAGAHAMPLVRIIGFQTLFLCEVLATWWVNE